jgi:hypothetical protein
LTGESTEGILIGMSAFRACAMLILLAALGGGADAAEAQLERGRNAILSLSGCYLVDYSYVETESLKPGYVKDSRVYDVNRDKSVKEWITAEVLSPRRIWLQRILFFADPHGVPRPGTEIRHQSEDWVFDASFLYDFVAPQTWQVKELRSTPGQWTRRVTNLDDGLRYQCAAPWSMDTAYPDWSCQSYAPIPGRESRDMSRSDYNALDRQTRIVAYGHSWLERQDNIKTLHGDAGRTRLVREAGKNWYVRLPDTECAAAQASPNPGRPSGPFSARPGIPSSTVRASSWRRRRPGHPRGLSGCSRSRRTMRATLWSNRSGAPPASASSVSSRTIASASPRS